MIDNLIWFILLSLLAEIIGTVSGFGSSLLFVPIAGYFLDFHSVLGIVALFHLASNISKITLFKRGINKQLLLNIGIPSVICVALGAYFTKFLNSSVLEIVLSIFLIGMSLTLLIFKQLIIKPTKINSIVGGAISGTAAGVLGTGGAIRGLTLAAFNLEMHSFIATSAFIDLGIDLTRSIVYTANGFVHFHDLYLVAILIVVGFTGTFIGKKILTYFSQAQFKKVLLILILVIGIITMVKQCV